LSLSLAPAGVAAEGHIDDVKLVRNELTQGLDWRAGTTPIADGIRVHGSADLGRFRIFARAWIGCTVRAISMAGISEHEVTWDLPARPIRGGEFEEVWSFPGLAGVQVKAFTVALWERRVDDCGCEYCKSNGYHLEGELDRSSWNWR